MPSEAFETEALWDFSQVRPTEAYWQSVEEAEREKPRQARGSDDAAGIDEKSGLTRSHRNRMLEQFASVGRPLLGLSGLSDFLVERN